MVFQARGHVRCYGDRCKPVINHPEKNRKYKNTKIHGYKNKISFFWLLLCAALSSAGYCIASSASAHIPPSVSCLQNLRVRFPSYDIRFLGLDARADCTNLLHFDSSTSLSGFVFHSVYTTIFFMILPFVLQCKLQATFVCSRV